MAFFGLFRRKPFERPGFDLYNAAVAAARSPYYYQTLGVPDTVDGRFDMIGLYVFLLVHRLHAASEQGKQLAQAIFDAMFLDMDFNLREIGISDMTVGKKVKDMMRAFHGRATAYGAALDAGDVDALSAAVARNVWRGREPDAASRTLAALMARQAAHLGAQPAEALSAGRVSFLPTTAAAA